MITKRQLIIGTLLILVMIAIGVYSLTLFRSRFIMQSEADIQTALLKQTPLGMNKSEVQTFVEKKGWGNPSTYIVNLPKSHNTSPFSFINGSLGSYSLPLSDTEVDVVWMFGPNDQLLEVQVIKETDDRQIPFFPLTK